ncbi:FtsX-like permease family protein [Saccharomonospora piscinae]|uniref:FtsX-like permease family protein n=1 Tax=Saccharomonospora piscinae TaxID=687388 RepID=UPI0004634075|nr:FtsX-like permease family protein [Saccharomonospora piscinae]
MHALRDLVLGARLAFRAGRTRGTGLVRTALTALGIGLAVAGLLLVFASGNGLQERLDRVAGRTAVAASAGEPSLAYLEVPSSYRGSELTAVYLHPEHGDAPVPPGLDTLPAPGEVVVSPALSALLDSDGGALLRPRFAETHIAGTIGDEGVAEPGELRYYVGAGPDLREAGSVESVGGFGVPSGALSLGPFLTFLLAIAGAVLVSPLLVFLASSGRLAAADAERRLSALRLVGADVGQIRRIAAAESLVGALTGLVLAEGLFLAGRPLVAAADLGGLSLFPEAMVPPWPVTVLVSALAPVVTVGSALAGLRHVIVEPLGVVRESATTQHRRGGWRVALVAVGVALFFPDVWFGVDERSGASAVFAGAGSMVLLVGVPVLVPWLVERGVRRLRGGRPSWQLGIRRLQLDIGTPARVAAGVTVVLAGAVALQALFGGLADRDERGSELAHVTTTESEQRVRDLVAGAPGVTLTGPGEFRLDPAVPEAVEHLRNGLAPLGWRVSVYRDADRDGEANTAGTLAALLGTASTFTLLLAGANLLVLTSAQVMRRRAAFAALRATGVPEGVLARSLLWQNGVPVCLGVVVASAVGLGTAALAGRLLGVSVQPSWLVVGGYSAASVLLVLAVTGAALVTLRAAVRDGLPRGG